jgi:hypothetical protein
MNLQNVESQFEEHLSAWREDEKTALELQKHDDLLAEAEICKLVLQSDY